jgi:D-amino-acid dehydrogenase
MHVIVVGGGVIGVTTAYCLSRAGCEVTVLERAAGVAQEASYGNAGMIAPGYVTPWAAPGMPGKVLSYLLKADAPVIFRPTLDPALWRWLIKWLGQCRLENYTRNKGRMQRIAFYSRAKLHEFSALQQLDYQRADGVLQLFRSAKDRALASPALAILSATGVTHEILDAAGCRRREPGIADTPFDGGVFLPEAEVGNCPLFTRHLRDVTEGKGVTYRFNQYVHSITSSRDSVEVITAGAKFSGDALVVCAGVESPALLRPLGVSVPIFPVKGYSATVPIREMTYAPLAAVMDEAYKVAMTRLGKRLRVAGTAEIGSRALELRDAALRTLIKVARDWFPGAADYRSATYWVGARPMLPDGPPLLGESGVPRVYLNVGHGSTGWTMACGSAQIVSDIVTGRVPEIDLEGLTLARYANDKKKVNRT